MPDEIPAPQQPQSTSAPSADSQIQLFCDIVMKGGITSGIVYPTLVQALSGTFTFKKIGGTSAGAIAAVATAAAELGRTTGRIPDSFDKLANLPNELGATVTSASPALGPSPTKLKSLFTPEASTTKAFSLLTVLVQEGLSFKTLWMALCSVWVGMTATVILLAAAWATSWYMSGDAHPVLG